MCMVRVGGEHAVTTMMATGLAHSLQPAPANTSCQTPAAVAAVIPRPAVSPMVARLQQQTVTCRSLHERGTY